VALLQLIDSLGGHNIQGKTTTLVNEIYLRQCSKCHNTYVVGSLPKNNGFPARTFSSFWPNSETFSSLYMPIPWAFTTLTRLRAYENYCIGYPVAQGMLHIHFITPDDTVWVLGPQPSHDPHQNVLNHGYSVALGVHRCREHDTKQRPEQK